MTSPKFDLGRVVATPGALALMEQYNVSPQVFLTRHVSGDWGDMDAEDKAHNDAALASGEERIFSAYIVGSEKIWVITEWDRSVTTLLLPEDY